MLPEMPLITHNSGRVLSLAITATLIVVIMMVALRRWRLSANTHPTRGAPTAESMARLEQYTPGSLNYTDGGDAPYAPKDVAGRLDVDGRTYQRATTSLLPEEGRDTSWIVGGDLQRTQNTIVKGE